MVQEIPVDEVYAAIVKALISYPEVTFGSPSKKGFGSSALKVRGKIFAMIDSKGEFVVKLPEQRVDALIAAGQGKRFDPRRGRRMREWLTVERNSEEACLDIAKEAMQFVASKP